MAYKIYEGLNAIFELKGPFAKLSNSTERKTIIQAALREGGEWFRVERIPLRFSDWVYRNGYRVTDSWKAFKRRVLQTGRATPYIGTTPPGGGNVESMISGMPPVYNGEKMAVAIERGCRVDITGTSRGGDIVIRTPYGHPIQPLMAEAFKRVTTEEYQHVARVVAAAFGDFLALAKKKSTRSKKLTIAGASSKWTPRGFAVDQRGGSITDRR